MRTLPPAAIAAELEQGLDLLQTSLRDVAPRHRSVRAVFDYSWRMLAPQEQQALARLSVFRAGFTREAAAAVAGASLPLLSGLTDKSLLQRDAAGRYRRHPLLWEYAGEQLDRQPALRHSAQAALVAYYADFLAARAARLKGGDQADALQEIQPETINLLAAWRHAVAVADLEALQRMHPPLQAYLNEHSWFREAAELWEWTRARVPADPGAASSWQPLLIGLGLGLGSIYYRLGAYEQARAALSDVLARAAACGDRLAEAQALRSLGVIGDDLGEYAAAEAHLRRAVAIARTLTDAALLGATLNSLGLIRWSQGALDEAETLLRESLALAEAAGDTSAIAARNFNLGNVANSRTHYDAALEYFERALALLEKLGNRWGVGAALHNKAMVLANLGDHETALALCYEAAQLQETLGLSWDLAASHISIAQNLLALGRPQETRAHLRAALHAVDSPQIAAAVIATQGTILWEGYADAAGAALWLQCAVTHEATLAYQRDECAALLTRVQAALDEAARERILAEGAQIAPQALLGTLLAGD